MKKRKRDYRRIQFFIILLAIFLTAWAGWEFGQIFPAFKDEITHVMILGVDRRDGDAGRSDTLIVATILEPDDDRKGKPKVSMLWIPRDTLVEIPKHDEDKIAHAFAYGGAKLSAEVVEKFLDVRIDHYVLIEKRVFERVIDAVDGIDIDVEKRMYYEDPWDDDGLIIDLYPGEQHLNGYEAIQYVRYRDSEGDIGRIRRQRHFIDALTDKILSPEIIPKLPYVIREIYNSIETDLTLAEVLNLSQTIKKSNGISSESVPGDPLYIDGVSYWKANRDKLNRIIDESMGGKIENASESKSQQIHSESTSSRK